MEVHSWGSARNLLAIGLCSHRLFKSQNRGCREQFPYYPSYACEPASATVPFGRNVFIGIGKGPPVGVADHSDGLDSLGRSSLYEGEPAAQCSCHLISVPSPEFPKVLVRKSGQISECVRQGVGSWAYATVSPVLNSHSGIGSTPHLQSRYAEI